MANVHSILLLLSLYFHGALGFLPSWMPVLTPAPELTRYTQGQIDTLLDVRLNIGLTAEQQFVIDGFEFKLCNAPLAKEESVVPLPGVWFHNL